MLDVRHRVFNIPLKIGSEFSRAFNYMLKLIHMNSIDYFFLFFLGTIAAVRLLLVSHKMAGPTIFGLRIRHYMPGIALLIFAFLIHNLTLYAIALGLIVDETPVVLVKGPGNKDEYWRGCEDYHTSWSFAGVLIIVLFVFIFRNFLVGLI